MPSVFHLEMQKTSQHLHMLHFVHYTRKKLFWKYKDTRYTNKYLCSMYVLFHNEMQNNTNNAAGDVVEEPIYFAVIKILSAVCLHNAICTVSVQHQVLNCKMHE